MSALDRGCRRCFVTLLVIPNDDLNAPINVELFRMNCLNHMKCLYVEEFCDCSRDDIVIWARKRTGTPVIRISTEKAAEEFLNKYHTFLIGRFDKFEVSKIIS